MLDRARNHRPVANHHAGKCGGRTAAKLRSYLRAAYSLAISSKTDPDAPLVLRSFGIETNPVASVGARALSKYNRARKRVLDASEMGAYLRRLDALPDGAQKDALRLLLFLGGQRPMQLLRATPGDIDLKAGTVTSDQGLRWYALERFIQLTSQQVEAVVAFLNCIVAHASESTWNADRATEALNSYWALPESQRPRGIEIVH